VGQDERSIEGMKVLVVDDTATNRQLLQIFLRKLGCTVILAEDGAQAVAAFEAQGPDLVLMDVMMPVMDGYEATRRIKALSRERWTPVVFLSALDKDENLVAGLEAGGDDYLAKPVNFVILNAKLRSLARTLRLQRSLDAERHLAAGIMNRLMLRQGLADPRVHHWLAPAAEFSGDVVAAAHGPDGRLYAMLADATGHGLAAAICVLPVLTAFYALVERGSALGDLANEMNRRLMAFMPTGRFVAAGLACVDSRTRQAELWVGGMPDLLLVEADGTVHDHIASSHLPLGIVEFDEEMARVQRFDCPPGSQLVIHSDGISEAADSQGQAFGHERLLRVLAGTVAEDRLVAVKAAVLAHTGGQPAGDDMSMLLLDC
jgi:CheY-like chemotaxis protein